MAVVTAIINLMFVAMSIHFVRYYNDWEEMKLRPEIRLEYGEKIIHLLCYEVLPAYAVVMIFAAVILWLLRK